MEESVVSDFTDELILGLPSITLTAKGAPARNPSVGYFDSNRMANCR